MNPSIESAAQQLGLSFTLEQHQQLQSYLALLEKWNKVYNLTALRDGERMLTHHVFDSLSILPALLRQGDWAQRRVLDVGSGAGLPGVILAIAMPGLSVTCIDTVGKKAAFIQQAAATLRLPNLQAIHNRVELWRSPQPFDLVTSRAFASLLDFTQWSRSQLAEQGVWLAMKGKVPTEELQTLPASVSVFHVEQLQVPELDAERCLVWMRPASSR